jgi:hypothetical protein
MAGKAETGVVCLGDIGVFPALLGRASGSDDENGEETTDGASVGTPHCRVKRNVPDHLASQKLRAIPAA